MYPILFILNLPFLSGPIPIPSYAVTYVVGFALASFLAYRRIKFMKCDNAIFHDCYLLMIIFTIIGARVGFIVTNWEATLASPTEIIFGWKSGGVMYGGLIGAILGLFIFVRTMPGWSFLEFADELVFIAPISHALGRVGCFLNGCCYGIPTDKPWGCVFPGHPEPRHPAQLYEAAAELVMFIYCARMVHKPHRYGSISMAYVGLYALVRFVVEMYRGDDRGATYFGLFSPSQMVSLFLLGFLAFLWPLVILRQPVSPPMTVERAQYMIEKALEAKGETEREQAGKKKGKKGKRDPT